MVTGVSNNLWVVYFTILIAFMMSAVPLPPAYYWVWPDWIVMVLIYWVLALPSRFNLGLAFVVGLMVDLLQSNFLGVNALAMVLTIFFAAILYRRMRMYKNWQQAFIIGGLVFINQTINLLGQALGGHAPPIIYAIGAALTSALLWPWTYEVLRAFRRAFRVA